MLCTLLQFFDKINHCIIPTLTVVFSCNYVTPTPVLFLAWSVLCGILVRCMPCHLFCREIHSLCISLYKQIVYSKYWVLIIMYFHKLTCKFVFQYVLDFGHCLNIIEHH